ncbi:MAG: membrane protein insertion efficiency factor YidD [Thermaurantimonas sp.]|uniref:membrane protein insertion efficiency factor YidD n=1 Tax=Thermaurantimonas TaxID=2681566 RepID=UPI0023F2CF16|nr:membrane protein insertion efficiency factor YidD [Thermaurantimonas aggregans]MCX8147786.1 membrane protein insertion efficiency factor YidD [Thermaurantimonas aggregans]
MEILKALKKLTGYFIILPVRSYQYFFSPFLPKVCRHTPSCSEYMIEAVQVWGPLKGTWLGLKRLSRCHPWGTYGYDPVPRPDSATQKLQSAEHIQSPED